MLPRLNLLASRVLPSSLHANYPHVIDFCSPQQKMRFYCSTAKILEKPFKMTTEIDDIWKAVNIQLH
jgi:hypothetical protein